MNLCVKDLCFRYKTRVILDKVSLELPSGSFCALLGANGAGKSTLIKCISGILRPSSGEIEADGEDLLGMPQRKRARLLGYVPQNTQAEASGLNVMETVLSGRLACHEGRLNQQDREIAMEVLEEMNLGGLAFRGLNQLSGGERQRVFIARAMARRPKMMLLDEPTSNLDLRYQQETLDLLKQLSVEKGVTILAILHDLNAAIAYGDQAALLKDGKIFRWGPPGEILGEREIWEVFQVRAAFARLENTNYIVPRPWKEK